MPRGDGYKIGRNWVLALAVAIGGAEAGEPYTPDDPQQVVERLPRLPLAVEALGRHNDSVTPDRPGALTKARRLIDLGRRTGDARYLGLAAGALKQATSTADPSTAASIARADLQQMQHDFDSALATLDRILARQPAHGQALLMKAVIYQVRGQSDQALALCRRIPYRYGQLAKAGCLAGAKRQTGFAAEGYRELRDALTMATSHDRALLTWSLALLAELAEINGDDGAAQALLMQAFERDPDDIRTRIALADLFLRSQQPDRVMEITDMDAAPPLLVLRRAVAARQIDSAEAEVLQRKVSDYFEALHLRGDTSHLREAAMAELRLFDNPQRALRLALRNWREQREFADTQILLAAALTSKNAAAVRETLHWLAQVGNVDERLVDLRRQLTRGDHDA